MDQLALRKNNPKAELSRELELGVIHQESVMNGYLTILDELQLSVSGFVEEVNKTDNKRLIHVGEIVFSNFSKLKGIEESYSKLNSLLYSISLASHRRGETLLELIPRLKHFEQKSIEYEQRLFPDRFIHKDYKDEEFIIEKQSANKGAEASKKSKPNHAVNDSSSDD